MASLTRSEASIVNEALSHLGSQRKIDTLDDRSDIAVLAKNFWASTLEAATSAHPWNHALAYAALPADSATPAHSYDFQYSLPADCLRWLPWAQDSEHYFCGEQVGSAIFTDAAAPLNIRYLRLVSEPRLWSPAFAKMMACDMAAQLCHGVTGEYGLSDRVAGKLDMIRRAAKHEDGLASGARDRRPTRRSRILNARMSGYGEDYRGDGYPYRFGDI